MATIRKLLGSVACFNPNCGITVPVKQGEGGAVSVSCQYCDFSGYGKEGSQAKADILRLMKPAAPVATSPIDAKPEPAVPVAAVVAVAAQPAAVKPVRKTVFG